MGYDTASGKDRPSTTHCTMIMMVSICRYDTASGKDRPSTLSSGKQVRVGLKSCFLKTFAIFPRNPACCRKTCFQKHSFTPPHPLLHKASSMFSKKLKTSTENSHFSASAKVFSFSWSLHFVFSILKQKTPIGNLMPVLRDYLNTYGTSQI